MKRKHPPSKGPIEKYFVKKNVYKHTTDGLILANKYYNRNHNNRIIGMKPFAVVKKHKQFLLETAYNRIQVAGDHVGI